MNIDIEALTSQEELTILQIKEDAKALKSTVTAQSIALCENVGAIKYMNMLNTMNSLTLTKWFNDRKQLKDYKNIQLTNQEGQLVTCKTFEELCKAMGFSYDKINHDIQNLSLLGEDFMTQSEKIGIGYRDLRKLRTSLKALPEDEQAEIMSLVKDMESKEELSIAIEEIASRNSKLRKEKEELKQNLKAKDEVLSKKNEKLDKVQAELTHLKNLSPDEKVVQEAKDFQETYQKLDKLCNEALGTFLTVLNQADLMLKKENMTDDATARISLLYQNISNLLIENQINIDFQAIVSPDF